MIRSLTDRARSIRGLACGAFWLGPMSDALLLHSHLFTLPNIYPLDNVRILCYVGLLLLREPRWAGATY